MKSGSRVQINAVKSENLKQKSRVDDRERSTVQDTHFSVTSATYSLS